MRDFGKDLLRVGGRRGRWLLVAVVVVVGVAGSANATTSTKWFDATIDWPTTISDGAVAEFDLTLKNDSTSTQTLGSANFWVPTGWTDLAASSPSVFSDVHSRTWNIAVEGDAFTFRAATNGDALAPGDSVTATVTAKASCAFGPPSWQVRAKQANSFSGPPGNDFQASDLVGLTAPASIAFTTQPPDGETGEEFTVEVTVLDACGNDQSGDVTLALVQPEDDDFGGGGVLDGTTLNLDGTVSQPLSDGTATFSDLTVDAAGQGYALDASYPGLPTVRSMEFSIYDEYGDCSGPTGCTHSDDTTRITLGPLTTTEPGGVSLRVATDAECLGFESLGVLSSVFTVVPPARTGPIDPYDIPVTLTINKPALQGVGVANIIVCKNSGPGSDLEQLGKCPKKGEPEMACIVSQTSSNAGDAVIKMLINSRDPGGAGFG